jgi:hypothetical protein
MIHRFRVCIVIFNVVTIIFQLGVKDMGAKYEALKNKLNENETYSQVNLQSTAIQWLNLLVEKIQVIDTILLSFSLRIWNENGNITNRIIL